jgi:hypothetical protein
MDKKWTNGQKMDKILIFGQNYIFETENHFSPYPRLRKKLSINFEIGRNKQIRLKLVVLAENGKMES